MSLTGTTGQGPGIRPGRGGEGETAESRAGVPAGDVCQRAELPFAQPGVETMCISRASPGIRGVPFTTGRRPAVGQWSGAPLTDPGTRLDQLVHRGSPLGGDSRGPTTTPVWTWGLTVGSYPAVPGAIDVSSIERSGCPRRPSCFPCLLWPRFRRTCGRIPFAAEAGEWAE